MYMKGTKHNLALFDFKIDLYVHTLYCILYNIFIRDYWFLKALIGQWCG